MKCEQILNQLNKRVINARTQVQQREKNKPRAKLGGNQYIVDNCDMKRIKHRCHVDNTKAFL